jgi:hypothetical protein
MKAYLVTTGILFALISLAHLMRTITEWSHFATDRWFILYGPGLGVVSGILCFWAWRLFRQTARP